MRHKLLMQRADLTVKPHYDNLCENVYIVSTNSTEGKVWINIV